MRVVYRPSYVRYRHDAFDAEWQEYYPMLVFAARAPPRRVYPCSTMEPGVINDDSVLMAVLYCDGSLPLGGR